MKNLHIYQGIILKRQNYGEADRILTFFTYEEGKLVALAKGVRKIKSKLGGNLELFAPVRLEIYHKEYSFNKIVGVSSIHNDYNENELHQDLDVINAIFGMAELVLYFTREGLAHPELYQSIVSFLQELKFLKRPILLLEAFKIKCCTILGFLPFFNTCVDCKQKLSEQRIKFLSDSNGFICFSCTEKRNLETNIKLFSALNITFTDIKLYNYLQKADFNLIKDIDINNHDLLKLKALTQIFIDKFLDRKLKTELIKM